MSLEFKKDDKFEDLGSFEDFFNNYGDCSVSIDHIDKPNIQLTVISNQEIEFKLVCSLPLSNIIREEKGFPTGMEKYRILRISRQDSSSYIRVSQSVDIELDISNSNVMDLDNKQRGNKRFVFKIKNV